MLSSDPIFRGQPPTNFTTAYTIPVGYSAIAKTLVLFNSESSAKKFSLRVIPSGDAIDDVNLTQCVLDDYSLNAGAVITMELQLALSAGDRVQWKGEIGMRAYLSGITTDQA